MDNVKLYFLTEDLYRLGNSTSSRLSNVRPSEIQTIELNGIGVIVANGNGVSVFTKEGLNESPLTGWVWEIRQGTALPSGLKIVKRGSRGHKMIVPTHNMPLNQYVGLLEQVAISCRKLHKRQV